MISFIAKRVLRNLITLLAHVQHKCYTTVKNVPHALVLAHLSVIFYS